MSRYLLETVFVERIGVANLGIKVFISRAGWQTDHIKDVQFGQIHVVGHLHTRSEKL